MSYGAWLVDVLGTYLFALKYVAMLLAVLLLVCGIDDLFIDLVYWARRIWRSMTIYRRHRRMHYGELLAAAEKPLAIMVPAWQEHGVIGNMAELAAITLDYENYHIFVGTYPNDPETQRDVDEVCARFPNVHKVVCARPGPTSKADCLNNVVEAIFRFERRASLKFAGFILHDSEDVLSAGELRLFNHLVGVNDLIQIPVYPLERRWFDFTSMHYMDEFSELHGKDVPVREALAGQVPSAGVGTCFSRRALMTLLEEGKGIAFDVQSLTEDYDIGFRLKAHGLREIFVRFPVLTGKRERNSWKGLFKDSRESNVICVREFFPDSAATAIRQKARWIVGIVYQGYRTHRWVRNPLLNYFLWRDRRGAMNNFVGFLAMLIFFQLLLLFAVQAVWPGAPRFLSIFEGDPAFRGLLLANLALMANRGVQRIFFVSSYYGLWQGLLSLPRMFWGNYINFMANYRALKQVVTSGDSRRVAWDKTMHDFPSLGDRIARRPLGEILVANGVLDRGVLEKALAQPMTGLWLGSHLVRLGAATGAQVAAAIAEQGDTTYEDIEPYRPEPGLLATVPAEIALRYGVIPLREDCDSTLILASEAVVDPVSMAALSRKLKRAIRCVIAGKGQVTVALRRHWVAGDATDPREQLDAAVRTGEITPERAGKLWESYTSMQVSLGEVLMTLGMIDAVAFRALLLRYRPEMRLGEYLVDQGILDRLALERALELQARLQPTMSAMIVAERNMLLAEAG